MNAHIAPFEQGNRYNHEPRRDRKLLLRRTEIDQLMGRAAAKGLTVVPLRLYINDKGRAKIELGLAQRQAAPRPAARHRRSAGPARRRARGGRRDPRPPLTLRGQL